MRHILRNRTIFPFHFIYQSFSNAKTTCEPLFARRENFRKFIPQPTLQNELNPLLTPPSTGVRKFATMVILVDFPNGGKEKAGTYVLLTHRAAKMKKHANEISVPGGAVEPGESLEEAALREVEEEIGLRGEYLKVWGELPPILFRNSSGVTTPFVSSLTDCPSSTSLCSKLILQEDEVQGVFLVSLSELLDQRRFTSFRMKAPLRGGLPFFYKLPVFVVENVIPLVPSSTEERAPKRRVIWGITAITLNEALNCIFPQ
ncbi:unnamed protein product [Meloidogyne enterolobii]|uniref:Uncharacterized protein n=1 Tax=Meloidogyne enterolobii TaxID=390850 RepID=A0ACB0ZR08_MELEN